jgi:hypothetical protein
MSFVFYWYVKACIFFQYFQQYDTNIDPHHSVTYSDFYMKMFHKVLEWNGLRNIACSFQHLIAR